MITPFVESIVALGSVDQRRNIETLETLSAATHDHATFGHTR